MLSEAVFLPSPSCLIWPKRWSLKAIPLKLECFKEKIKSGVESKLRSPLKTLNITLSAQMLEPTILTTKTRRRKSFYKQTFQKIYCKISSHSRANLWFSRIQSWKTLNYKKRDTSTKKDSTAWLKIGKNKYNPKNHWMFRS